MATSKLLLQRLRPFRSVSHVPLGNLLVPSPLLTSMPTLPPHLSTFQPFRFFHSRSEDINNSASDSLPFQSDLTNLTERLIESSGIEESFLPVRALTSVLDSYHDLTGFPWWIVITSSVLALRVTLLPVVILQLQKMKKIAELSTKLPPPFPPPLSGKSFIDQILHFRRERKAIGCPSFLWFLSSFSVQVPCFLLCVTTIRRMSLDSHPGFDCGGILWFKDLTEFPHGVFGLIFPILVAGLHYTNVQISFGRSTLGKGNDLFGLLAKFYKLYLDVLTLPLFLISFSIPQGSLVYWVTNSTLSVIQQASLKHPAVRAILGLPDKDAPTAIAKSEPFNKPEVTYVDLVSEKSDSVENLTPKELVNLSVLLLSKGEKERPISLLKLALQKDPDYSNALITIGRVLILEELPADGAEYLERAVSKLIISGYPTKAEDVDLLIIASQWAGLACTHQGKMAEGIAHLQRIANMKEPEEPRSKANYFSGLVMLSSALLNEGRKAEAAKYLRLAAAYNADYNELLEQCENDEDKNFVSDLANSRRGDY